MKHLGTKTLETERLILRPFTMEDAQAMFDNWANDPVVTKYLTWPAHTSVEVTEAVLQCWINDYAFGEGYHWGIVLKETGELIGDISAARIFPKFQGIETGYCMGQRWWHRGIMPEAFRRVLAYWFEEVGAQRVSALHDVNNPASGAVMRRCGLLFEGVHRGGGFNNQGIVDVAEYAMTAADWRERTAKDDRK